MQCLDSDLAFFISMATQPAMANTAREREWEAEQDHRILTQAEEIRTDRKRMAGVRRHHRKSMRALSRIGRSINGRNGGRK